MANHIDDATIGNKWGRKRRYIKERTRSAGQRLCRAKDDHIGGRR